MLVVGGSILGKSPSAHLLFGRFPSLVNYQHLKPKFSGWNGLMMVGFDIAYSEKTAVHLS